MSIKLYLHTVKYLKLSQLLWRLYYRFSITAKIDQTHAPALRQQSNNWVKPIEKDIKMLGPRQFKFLNYIKEIKLPMDWNNSECSKLWLYNLHYFDDLVCKNAHMRKQWHQQLLKDWIQENPIGLGSGWEPYPVSLRIVNWIKWGLSGNTLEQPILDSLATQVRYLTKRLEYHLLGNHIIANAKALIYAGLFFIGDEANAWFTKGMQILVTQLPEQILPDGGNFELSPMYHAIILEDLLDIVNINNCYGKFISQYVTNTIKSMCSWLIAMTHPNKEISFFNDAANGIAATVEDLQNYCQLLGLNSKASTKVTYLNNSGYVRIEDSALVAIIDIAPIGPDYMPGHAHADTFSFECSLFAEKVIVNSGVSLYSNSEERILQRGTRAHSTLAIDGQDSSEVWGGFRVARRARIINPRVEQKENKIIVAAKHDGYCRLYGKPIHSREWHFSKNCIEVLDFVTGRGKHDIEIICHLAPAIIVEQYDENLVYLFVKGHKVTMRFVGEGVLTVIPSNYYPRFGECVLNNTLVWSQVNNKLPYNNKMILTW